MSEAPIRAMDRDTMVPNTPVRMRMLLMNLGRLPRVLSDATRVAASALWLMGVLQLNNCSMVVKRRCMMFFSAIRLSGE